jgi:hypothetical protein
VKSPLLPIEQWGRDHWSTYAYLASRILDYRGKLAEEQMRVDPSIHPLRAHRGTTGTVYPTRLKDGSQQIGHDDWSCIDDFEEAGLVNWGGSGLYPIFSFTEKGYQVWFQLYRWIAEHPGAWSATFAPTMEVS